MAVSVYTGAGGGVASFNGRKGKVVPADGDYTKAQVGLGNVDNTSDANKPISNATQAALNDKQSKITANGILKGDGSGNISAANETEVELVSLPNICNPNLLDNWYFGKPVNQRGQTSWNTAGYHLDRWLQEGAGNGHVGSGGYTCPGSTTTIQKIEKETYEVYRGNTFTISALLSTNELIFGTGVWTDNSEVTAKKDDNSLFVKAAAFPSANSYQACRIYSDTNADNTILAVKLELGSQQTLAHQENGTWVLNEIPDYGEQLRRCQRYYWKVDHNNWPGVSPFAGTYNGERIVLNGLTFPVTMRTKPTISNLILYDSGSGESKAVTDSGWGLFDYVYNNIFPTSGNLDSGHTYSVQHVEFSADL